jgi:hypothetical protein
VGSGTLEDSVEFLRYGGLGRTVLACADAATQDLAVAAVRDALAPCITAEGSADRGSGVAGHLRRQ